MRILLVTPMPPRAEAPGAIPLVLHAALTGLSTRHEVTLVTAVGDEPGELDAALSLQRSADVHIVDRRRPAGLARWRRRGRLAAAWARSRDPWRTVWFADPRLQHAIDALVASREFDVAAVQDNSMGTFRLPASLPSILTEHEVQDLESTAGRLGWRMLDRRRWRSYQPRVWRRFDRIEVFTTRDALKVAELAPDLRGRVRVNPFGIVLPRRADPAREDPGLVLFVGNFTHPPNVDAALWLAGEIMPLLRARREGVRLVLVGGGAPKEVRALAGKDVDFIGEAPAIAPYLETAAVVLAPIRTGGGMRMKVLHALASGKAVVTTRRGAEGLVFGSEEAPLVVAEDAETIASETARLLADSTWRRSLGERARAFAAERHSSEAYGRRLEAVYEEVASMRASPVSAAAGD